MTTVTVNEFVGLLGNGLWHTTIPDRCAAIATDGAIVPNPPAPYGHLWLTDQAGLTPYVRTLGGVSLFDLTHFDPDTYNDRHCLATWRSFIPVQEGQAAAVWFEVDRARLSDYVDPPRLLDRWRQAGSDYQYTFMPEIEGAHIGPIPLTALERGLWVERRPQDAEFSVKPIEDMSL